jgi:hypothetical protein
MHASPQETQHLTGASMCLRKILQISSALGSIGILQKQLTSPDPQMAPMSRNVLAYRASKSALNMGARSTGCTWLA